jgi:hypothetical protein
MTQQLSIFGDTIPQRFEAWKLTRGGAFCLCQLYALTAGYALTYRQTGIRPSTRLVWEQLRYRLNVVRRKLAAKGHRLEQERGFWLNDHFTAHAIRSTARNGAISLNSEKSARNA